MFVPFVGGQEEGQVTAVRRAESAAKVVTLTAASFQVHDEKKMKLCKEGGVPHCNTIHYLIPA